MDKNKYNQAISTIRNEITMRFAVFSKKPKLKEKKVAEMYEVLNVLKEMALEIDQHTRTLKELREIYKKDAGQ